MPDTALNQITRHSDNYAVMQQNQNVCQETLILVKKVRLDIQVHVHVLPP
jgi:hypothetical protein